MFTSIVVLCVLCVIAAVSMVVLLWKHYQMLDEIDVLNDEIDSFSSEMDELSNKYEAIIAQKEHDHAKFMEWAKQQVDELKVNHEAEIAALKKQHDDYLFQSTGSGCGSVGSQSICPKDDDTRDLPAVDSEFTLPKVDDDTLLYRGLMGSAEMEDVVKLMVDAYRRDVVNMGSKIGIDDVLFMTEDFDSCITGFRMLVDNGWLHPKYDDSYRVKQSLIERICTRPELAAKIGKGVK